MMRHIGFATALLFTVSGTAQAQTALTESGPVRGESKEGIISYKGIPFAAPPVGDLRWRAPQPVQRWNDVRDAKDFGHDCAQLPFPSDAAPLGTAPDEDCLTLNIWSPANGAKRKLPVLVWIYGGGFVNGGSSPDVYSGTPLAKQGIMVVSLNYRLGRFGFFAHPALSAEQPGATGNFGFMDQVAALRWVKRNIAAFGGDPAQVTIMGESAGGGSVSALMNNPLARGLFARAVNMSGGGRGFAPPRLLSKDLPGMPSAESVGQAFAAKLGITGTDKAALVSLRSLSAEKVIDGFNLASLFTGGANGPTGPIIDGVTSFESNEAAIARHTHAKIPVMIGATSADIGFISAKNKDELFAMFGAKASRARALFDPSGDMALMPLIFKVGGIRTMIEPARFVASSYTGSKQNVWLYRFGYVASSMRKEWGGAPHATDIPYFMNTVAAKYGSALTPADADAARQMSGYLANFVKKGNPNGARLPAWRKFDQSASLLNFSSDHGPVSMADPLKEQLDLVEGLAQK